jgi:CRP/FNR family cyclic AMP-dependent transcriptional regulator
MTDKPHRHDDIGEQRRLEETVLHLLDLSEQLAAHGDSLWFNTPEMKALNVLRNKVAHGGENQPTPAELSAAVEKMTDFLLLIERSSLGTPASHRIRRLSSARDVAAILARADQPLRQPAATEQPTMSSQAISKADEPRIATAEAEERGTPGGEAAAIPDQGAFLAYLADADREYLLARGTRRRFRANDVVLLEGDPSDHVHVLVSGWVRVSSVVEDGREVFFGLRGPGEVLGDVAALTGRPRTASVRAIEPCTVFQLTGAEFIDVLHARPEIAIATIKAVAARLRNADSAHIDSAAFDVNRRVAVQLVRLAEEHGRTVPEGVVIEAALSQADIAAQVGAARRTVARALRVLRESGIVETGRRRILIREPRLLRAFARSDRPLAQLASVGH